MHSGLKKIVYISICLMVSANLFAQKYYSDSDGSVIISTAADTLRYDYELFGPDIKFYNSANLFTDSVPRRRADATIGLPPQREWIGYNPDFTGDRRLTKRLDFLFGRELSKKQLRTVRSSRLTLMARIGSDSVQGRVFEIEFLIPVGSPYEQFAPEVYSRIEQAILNDSELVFPTTEIGRSHNFILSVRRIIPSAKP